jgi:hypothetical protein
LIRTPEARIAAPRKYRQLTPASYHAGPRGQGDRVATTMYHVSESANIYVCQDHRPDMGGGWARCMGLHELGRRVRPDSGSRARELPNCCSHIIIEQKCQTANPARTAGQSRESGELLEKSRDRSNCDISDGLVHPLLYGTRGQHGLGGWSPGAATCCRPASTDTHNRRSGK